MINPDPPIAMRNTKKERETAIEIGGAQQDLDGVVHHLQTALKSAGPVEGLLILKHIEAAARLQVELEQFAAAIHERYKDG